MDHLLLYYEAACALWNFFFFGRFVLSWVMHRRVVHLYSCWLTVEGVLMPFVVFMEKNK
jgi:fucose permease